MADASDPDGPAIDPEWHSPPLSNDTSLDTPPEFYSPSRDDSPGYLSPTSDSSPLSTSPATRAATSSDPYAPLRGSLPDLKLTRLKSRDDGDDSSRRASPRLMDIGPQTTPTLRTQQDIDSFVDFFKEFDKNNDGEIDEEEMTAISRDVLATKYSLSRFKITAALVAGMIVLFLLANMGLTAFVLFLYKDMALASEGDGKVLVTPSGEQVIRIKPADMQVHGDVLLQASSQQVVLGTAEFLYRRNLSLDITSAQALALRTLHVRLPDVDYIYQVESATRITAPQSAVVEALVIRVATGASVEVTETAITATSPQERGKQGLILWRLANYLSARAEDGDWEAVAYFDASHESSIARNSNANANANANSEEEEQDPGSAPWFAASISALAAQYEAELSRLATIFSSIQESKAARIDALRAEIAEIQEALGIV